MQEPEVGDISKMEVGRERKTGNVSISPKEHQDGRFQTAEDTLRVFLRNSSAFGVTPFRSFGVLTFWRLGNSQKWKGDK